MKKFITSLVVAITLVAVVPGVASAHHNNSQPCYNYDEEDYESCDHSHLNNYYGSNYGYYSGNGYYNNYNNNSYYNNYNRYATQTYYKPVSRYTCDYSYYYGNTCSYDTDYVQSYRQVPVTGYTYDSYSYNYSNYPYNSYTSYNNYSNYGYNNYGYNNYAYGYSYPYSSAYYGSYWY